MLQPSNQIMEHPKWAEICVLLRFVLMLSFNNRLNVLQFLPELCDIIVMVMAKGSMFIRLTVHALLINILHSLCTDPAITSNEQEHLHSIIEEISEPRYRLIFGIKKGTANAFMTTADMFTELTDRTPLTSLESGIQVLIDVLGSSAVSSGNRRMLCALSHTLQEKRPPGELDG